MTIRRLLIINTIIVFLIGYIGVSLLSIYNFRLFLENAAQQQALNTANTLAFTLSQPNVQTDAARETVINAIFETGDYHEVSLFSPDGKVILSRTLQNNLQMPPQWFISAFPIDGTSATALVSNGWQQIGTIKVAPEVSFAYLRLWSTSKQVFYWFSSLLALTLIIELIAVYLLLRPLDAIKQQAMDIINHKFNLSNRKPLTRELQQIVATMNVLTKKVQASFEEQTGIIEQLRDKAYKDSLTKVGNRRYFNMQTDSLLSRDPNEFQGALFLIELKGIDKFKKEKGYELAELYLLHFADIIKGLLSDNNSAITARLSDYTFALILPHYTPTQAHHFANTLTSHIAELSLPGSQEICFNMGIAIYKTSQSRSEFLAAADLALRSAQLKGENTFYMHQADETISEHLEKFNGLKTLLENNLANLSYTLYFQPAFSLQQGRLAPMSFEALLRLYEGDGKYIGTGDFIKQLENTKLITQLDMAVVTKAASFIEQNKLSKKIAINLEIASILNPQFNEWFVNLLSHQPIAKQLIIELPEDMVTQYIALVKQFIERFRAFGCEFALDNFGKGFNSLRYIRGLDIQTVKIDASLTQNIIENTEDQFYVSTLISIAHNLDIKAIAKNVESKEQQDTLVNLGIDGLQGYLYAKPAPLLEMLEVLATK